MAERLAGGAGENATINVEYLDCNPARLDAYKSQFLVTSIYWMEWMCIQKVQE